MQTMEVVDVLGTRPSGAMKNKKGMDDIDRWAERMGKREKELRQMAPRKKRTFVLQ